jgi:hypothetical protein
MADNRTHLSVPIKGMNQDVHPSNLSEQGYDHALNTVVEDFSGNGFPILQNESSTLKCANFPTGYKVVGVVNVIEQERKVLFLTNTTTGFSQIGEIIGKNKCGDSLVDNDSQMGYCSDCGDGYVPEQAPLEDQNPATCCQYIPIATQTCFNFDFDHPVRPVYRLEDCGISIYFGDNFNYNRYIEFDYVDDDSSNPLKVRDKFKTISGYDDCGAPLYGSQIDCNKLRIDPVATVPNLDLVDVVGGGSLKAGTYQFLFSYADKDGNKRSPYLNATNPVPIFTRDVTFDTDYQTDRSIVFEVDGIDANSPFEYFNIAVVKTINNVSSFEYVGTYPIGTTRFTYTGNEKSLKDLDANDIFEQKVYYSKSRGAAVSNNYLFWYSPEETKKLNIQRIANNVKLQWQTTQLPEHVYRDLRDAYYYKGYLRDEVYPFGIVFIYDNDEESIVGHIPNRVATNTDREIITNNDAITESSCDDCGDDTSEPQVHAGALNTTTFTPTPPGVVLNEDNSDQDNPCVYVPYSVAPTPPHYSGTGMLPVVQAGDDKNITYDGVISLNGNSFEYGGLAADIINNEWKQIDGPNQVTIAEKNQLNTYFGGYITGTYNFQLVATDANGNINGDTIQFVIDIGPNDAPVADPGEDKLITSPTSASYLNGGNSTDDQAIATYQWSQVSGPNTATIVKPTMAYTDVTGLIVGTYQFKLVVTDNKGCSSDATTYIYVYQNPCDSVPDPTNLLYPVNGSITSSFTTVVLGWEDSSCATSYDIYLAIDGFPYTLVGNSTVSNYTLTNLDANTVYNWYVVPKNAAGSAVDSQLYYRTFVTPTEQSVSGCDRERWEVYNTASITATPHQAYVDCQETCWESGEFAYWESSERYPNIPEIWGDLCGEPIRFHKFPDNSITHIHDGLNGDRDYKRNNVIYPIGVKVDHTSVRAAIDQAVTDGIITLEDKNRIKGYKIVRGNRFGNKSIVAKGLLYDVNQYRRKRGGTYFDNDVIYFPNYPYNDTRDNPFVTDDFRNYDEHNTEKGANLPFIFSKRYTFHSPDTSFSEPFIGSKLKLETIEYGASEGYFTVSKRQAKQKFLSNASYIMAFALGIVAALTKTNPIEQKEYTVKGTVVSAMGIAAGAFGPYLPYQSGTGAAIIPESILDTVVNAQRAASINAATEVTTQTLQGRPKDWRNPLFLATKQPLLLPLLPVLLAQAAAGLLSTVLMESGIVLDLIKSLTPYRDWCIQFNSIGKYNSYRTVANTGNKIRAINSWRYLKGENSLIPETSDSDPTQYVNTKINNWHREEAVYLRYAGNDFPQASVLSGVIDKSRYSFDDEENDKTLDKRITRDISSYYASIKNYKPDQYGTVYNVEYISTGSQIFDMTAQNSECKTVFGGDTFINRFALKKKVPYFLADTFDMADGTDFNYTAFPNLGVPRHYYDSTAGVFSEFDSINDVLGLVTANGVGDLLGRPKSLRDGVTNKFFYQNGYIYLYSYGIPYFLVESDVNVDFRYAENLSDKAFFPLQQDLDFWLQEENVRLREPNYYFYNNTYSKQNKEHSYTIYPASFEPGRNCRVNHPNGIIYSNGANWLQYKPNDFYTVPLSEGRLISVDGIENDKILIRAENNFQVHNSYITIPTSAQSIAVGNGGMFANKPQEFSKTTLGHAGTQHQSILHTEFGHIWIDAKRGQVVNLSGEGFDELSKYGMKNWFKENLPFNISKDFPAIQPDDLDNNFKGIGIAMAFDKRFSRMLITKLDYKLLDKTVIYDTVEKVFKKDDVVVSLLNNKYFCNKSWTVSFSFLTKAWTSFHSYKPNYYIDSVEYFSSGLNADSSLWDHNLTNKSYQVFYGKVFPWSIQTITKYDVSKNHLNSVEYSMDAIRYHNEYDQFYNNQVTFNKAVVSNQSQSTGTLKLDFNTKQNLNVLTSYPKANVDSTTIRVTNSDGVWRFNQFYDLASSRTNNIPLWLNNCANTERVPNPKAINYQTPDLDKRRIRGEWNRVMLINDEHTNYKMIFKWLQNNSVKTYR